VEKELNLYLKMMDLFFLNISGRPSDSTLPFDLAARLTKNVDFNLQNTIHWIKSVSVDPEDIGRNNGFHNRDNIAIGHFKPIVSDRYLSDLHEYIFHFT
jgi:site-specific DNA-methyltransferase (adenine-specific)